MRSWPQDVQVAPSILSSDFGRVREQVAEVMEAGARVIHIDVMDGHFVPVITFGPKMLADVADVIHGRDGYADVLLCMSVNPGWGGQEFIPATLDRLPRLRALASARDGVAVEVDGGIHEATITGAHSAGANILVAGSA